MNKQSMKQSLMRNGKDFLGLYEIAEIIGVDRSTARKWMHGISYLPCGTKKLYHVNDVAERLMQLREQ